MQISMLQESQQEGYSLSMSMSGSPTTGQGKEVGRGAGTRWEEGRTGAGKGRMRW